MLIAADEAAKNIERPRIIRDHGQLGVPILHPDTAVVSHFTIIRHTPRLSRAEGEGERSTCLQIPFAPEGVYPLLGAPTGSGFDCLFAEGEGKRSTCSQMPLAPEGVYPLLGAPTGSGFDGPFAEGDGKVSTCSQMPFAPEGVYPLLGAPTGSGFDGPFAEGEGKLCVSTRALTAHEHGGVRNWVHLRRRERNSTENQRGNSGLRERSPLEEPGLRDKGGSVEALECVRREIQARRLPAKQFALQQSGHGRHADA